MTLDEMHPSWSFVDAGEYVRRVTHGMPPVIVTCATTGEYRKHDHPGLPASGEEQAEAAKALFAAGARIIHIHGRVAGDPDRSANDPQRYREINELIRAAAPEILIDNTQTIAEVCIEPREILGKVHYYKSAPIEARPDLMALNPGPMTFRGERSGRAASTSRHSMQRSGSPTPFAMRGSSRRCSCIIPATSTSWST